MSKLAWLKPATRGSVLVGAIATAIAGCVPAPGTHDPGYVAKEWSMTMREFGIVPVFPPREDVQVGDIYAMPVPPDDKVQLELMSAHDGHFVPIPILLASVDVRTELSSYYDTRISFPRTPGTQPTSQPGLMPQPSSERGGSVFEPGDNTRLRLGGFPEFFSAQISQGGIGGLVPTEAVNVAFGALASANNRVRVSVPMVESYGLPAGELLTKVDADTTNRTITFGDRTDPATTMKSIPSDRVVQLLQTAGGDNPRIRAAMQAAHAKGYFVLITEIYATRAIDISVEAEVSNAGGINLRPTAELLAKLPGFAASQPAATQPVPTTATAADFDYDAPAAIAARQTNALNAYLAAQVPGVNVKFLSVTAFGVTMRRTYERPIVIGYRGIVYKVDDFDQVAIAGSANGAAPISVSSKQGRQIVTDLEQALPQLVWQVNHGQLVGKPTVNAPPSDADPTIVDQIIVTLTTDPALNEAESNQVRDAIIQRVQVYAPQADAKMFDIHFKAAAHAD